MSTVPDFYEGREQALIKHTLLKIYLEKLVLIIGMSAKQERRVEICYVDCFAGPWGSTDNTLEGTSISLSLNTLESCKRKLASLGVEAHMRALYIEKDPEAFRRLSTFLTNRASAAVEHDCKPGDFVDLRAEILNWCGTGSFVFFFVDPKGWKDILIDTMRPLLTRPRSEFLINFAYNFINRTASMKEWQDAMVLLLGQSVNLTGRSPSEREEALVNSYREGLKRCVPSNRGFRARTAYVSVLDPIRRRTKYHLIYLTSHPTGIVEFMTISEKIDTVQALVRTVKQLGTREKKSGIPDLFAQDSVDAPREDRSGPEEVDSFWRQYLAGGDRRIGTAEFADILEEKNWLPVELQTSLVRLVKAGVVKNLDANAARRHSRPLHFEHQGERLALVSATDCTNE